MWSIRSVACCVVVAFFAAPDARPSQPEFVTDTLTQAQIAGGLVPIERIRLRGMKVFSFPFTKSVGYGDGPMNPLDPTTPGNRPTLQNNGTLLRANGLDAQTCFECHTVVSFATVPFTFGIGGVGASSANVLLGPKNIDVDDEGGKGFADFDGRFINPPFLFGSGGVQLAAKEMTTDLQALMAQAIANPDVVVPLVTKGVSFGSIVFTGGALDTSNVEGIDADLVVRPFGRKGEFSSIRNIDVTAMRFHFGMEPVEFAGLGVDHDGDGVVNELSEGDMSALEIFNTNLERPRVAGVTPRSEKGRQLFTDIGCAVCHVPELNTTSRFLRYALPEVATHPAANIFYAADMTSERPGFDLNGMGGITVPLYSDLKRHDMGPELAESTGHPLQAQFVTARLWGIADTAPYLHDGRALLIEDAILAHGGEAKPARDAFAALSPGASSNLLAFLDTLRTPVNPAADLLD